MSRHNKKSEAVALSSKIAHVLIVDDEQDITDLMQNSLSRTGIKVTTYNDPLKAIQNFRPRQYDLAIFDVRMPGMNGFDLFKSIKELDHNLKICFLTAFELQKDDFSRNSIDPETVNCFIKKPIRISEFLKRVQCLLEG